VYSMDEDNNIYSMPGPNQWAGSQGYAPWHSTPRYDVPPSQFDSAVMPSNIAPNNTTAQNDPSEMGAGKARHHQSKRAHRSKRKGHKVYDLFENGAGSAADITIEYKGRMPRKNSSVAMSRDSGVNCMGLPPNRQHYMEEAELYVTQEASAYLPGSRLVDPHPTLTTSNTAQASSHHHDTTQRGSPYTSMDQRDPEGCSQLPHQIINPIGPNSPMSAGEPTMSDSQDAGALRCSRESVSGGGDGEESGSGEGRCSELEHNIGSAVSPPGMDERSEGEGVSHHSTPHYPTAPAPNSTDTQQVCHVATVETNRTVHCITGPCITSTHGKIVA
jgi:hypothetical protein